MRCLSSRSFKPFGTATRSQITRKASCRAQKSDAAGICSKRELLGCSVAAASLLLLQQPAGADEAAAEVAEAAAAAAAAPGEAAVVSSSSTAAAASGGGKQVFLDVTVEGQPAGRIVIELLNSNSVGGARFADLAEGKEGVGYRLAKFDGIFGNYIRNEGVKSLSYNARGDSQIAGGDSVQALEEEMSASSASHDSADLVSLVVREATERPVKVVGGSDVVAALSALPYARPRDSYYDKPFFEAGKMLGDKRATVAEKRFNRPLVRVMVAQSGLL